MRAIALALAVPLALGGVAAPAAAAEFKFERSFAGTTYATGRFSAINGVKRDFKVVLNGRWNGKRLKLREDFTFADGERDTKTWTFVKTGPDSYVGTREDVKGEAKVTVRGRVARYSYDLYLDAKARKNLVRFHDTMILNPDGSVTNTAWVTKFGLPVAYTRVEFTR